MKKIICIISLSLFTLTEGCKQQETKHTESPASSIPEKTIEKVQLIPTVDTQISQMKISPSRYPYTTPDLNVTIYNHLSDTIYFGPAFELELFDPVSSVWKNILPPDLMFTLVLYSIPPHDSYDYSINLDFLNLKPGKYQLKMNTFQEGAGSSGKNNLMIAGFELE